MHPRYPPLPQHPQDRWRNHSLQTRMLKTEPKIYRTHLDPERPKGHADPVLSEAAWSRRGRQLL